MKKEYDVAIVGAGPSGLFTAYELSMLYGKTISIGLFDKGETIKKRVCPSPRIEEGCMACSPCHISDGIMGAGMMSDGKLHFHKDVMEVFRMGLLSGAETDEALNYLESLFEKWGLKGPVYPLDQKKALEISQEINKLMLGDNFVLKVKQKTRHVGSDRSPLLVSKMVNEILYHGNVDIQVRSSLLSYDNIGGESILTFKDGNGVGKITAGKTFIGLGRRGSLQVQDLIDQFSIPHSYRPVEIGGRVEIPIGVMKKITDQVYNPFFWQKNDNGTVTFTFCANPGGFLTTESLLPGIAGVNGEGRMDTKSPKTNFAVLTVLDVPHGARPNDTLVKILKSGFSNQKPLTQTTADFVGGKMDDELKRPESTMSGLEYGNIAQIFPENVTKEIRSFLLRLDAVCPGVVSHDSLFVAPEAKIRGMRVIPRDKGLMTDINGLYLIGDSSGLSSNVTAAAMTGVLAARDS